MATKKITQHKLEFEPEFDFMLLGIISSEASYKLSLFMNSACSFRLVRQDDIELKQQKNGSTGFSFFSYEDENTYLKYNLIQNKTGIQYLIPELKNIDYLIQIIGEPSQNDVDTLTEKLKSIPEISGVLKIDPVSLKSRNNLIF
jgi:hypothetical protein